MAHFTITSDQTGVIIRAYRKALHRKMQKTSPLLNYAQQTAKKVGEGYTIYGAIEGAPNPSGTPVAIDGGAIPDRGRAQYYEANFSPKYHYVGLGISLEAIKMTSGNMAKYFDLMKAQFDDAHRCLERQCSNALRGYGLGVVATINMAVPAATNLQLDNARFVTEGQVYDVVDPGTGTSRGSFTVSLVKNDGKVNVDALPGGTADDDFLVYTGQYNNDVMGLMGLADDGTLLATFGGLTVANVGRYWQGNRDVSASRTIDVDPIFDMADTIGKASDEDCTNLLASPEWVSGMARKYINDVRWKASDMPKKIGPGWKQLYLQAGGPPLNVIRDRDHTGPHLGSSSDIDVLGTVFMWCDGSWEFHEWFPPEWIGETPNESGARQLHRSSTNFEFLGELVYGINSFTFNRRGLGHVGTFSVTENYKS